MEVAPSDGSAAAGLPSFPPSAATFQAQAQGPSPGHSQSARGHNLHARAPSPAAGMAWIPLKSAVASDDSGAPSPADDLQAGSLMSTLAFGSPLATAADSAPAPAYSPDNFLAPNASSDVAEQYTAVAPSSELSPQQDSYQQPIPSWLTTSLQYNLMDGKYVARQVINVSKTVPVTDIGQYAIEFIAQNAGSSLTTSFFFTLNVVDYYQLSVSMSLGSVSPSALTATELGIFKISIGSLFSLNTGQIELPQSFSGRRFLLQSGNVLRFKVTQLNGQSTATALAQSMVFATSDGTLSQLLQNSGKLVLCFIFKVTERGSQSIKLQPLDILQQISGQYYELHLHQELTSQTASH